MFTGIIERSCTVVACCRDGDLHLALDLSPLRAEAAPDGPLVALGDSVAIDGVCLTVARLNGDRAGFDVIPETLRCTALGSLEPGASVNVERALRFGDRVDGHLVQGHVEGTGTVRATGDRAGEVWMEIDCGAGFAARLLLKGSVAVDGVSLTVAALEDERFAVALVPHTLERTGLGRRQPGDRVHLEPDMIGQWVLRAVQQVLPSPP